MWPLGINTDVSGYVCLGGGNWEVGEATMMGVDLDALKYVIAGGLFLRWQ
jgi:hypothetical protein